MKITFLGAGAFGKALGEVAKENYHEAKFYDPYRYPSVSLESAIEDTDAIVFVAPSSAAKKLLPKLPESIPLICASKGFLSLKPFEKFKNFSALGGAAFAKDIINRTPRFGDQIVLTASSELSEKIFSTKDIKVEYTKDSLGIMLCGALKNVYAIGIGLTGDHSKDYLQKIYQEIVDILKANSADENTAKLSCGLPDLLMSATDGSRNLRFGEEIKNNPYRKVEIVGTVEGVNVINSLKDEKDFRIPDSAVIFKDIVEKVNHATS